jgi:ElaB/YqjD/DUF883 family membrane-anchored ribosome-binding protein
MNEHEGSSGQSQSTVEQAQEKVQEAVQHASGTAMEAVRQQVETRAGQAGTELRAVGQAMRRSGHSLHADGNDAAAKAVDVVTDRIESLAGYLGSTSGERMLEDVEAFGRRQPWVMIGAGVTVGFLASRFLKASSNNRYTSTISGPAAASAVPRPPAGIPLASPAPSSIPGATARQPTGAAASGW